MKGDFNGVVNDGTLELVRYFGRESIRLDDLFSDESLLALAFRALAKNLFCIVALYPASVLGALFIAPETTPRVGLKD